MVSFSECTMGTHHYFNQNIIPFVNKIFKALLLMKIPFQCIQPSPSDYFLGRKLQVIKKKILN